jgi:hypothetical protein
MADAAAGPGQDQRAAGFVLRVAGVGHGGSIGRMANGE